MSIKRRSQVICRWRKMEEKNEKKEIWSLDHGGGCQSILSGGGYSKGDMKC